MSTLYRTALSELQGVFDRLNDADVDQAIEMIAKAKKTVVFGGGRERLQIMGFAMRLYHMGLDAHVVGDMSCPPVGKGDFLVVSAGPGAFSTVMGLIDVARVAGAKVACVTATPNGSAAQASDLVLEIPAQTMADDQGTVQSVLPMGSLFEGAQYLTFELLILGLRDHIGVDPGAMRARHTNLE